MFDDGSASDVKLQRSRGDARLTFDAPGGVSRIRERFGAAPLRLLTPSAHGGPPEAVIANTAGGIAGGDILTFSVAAEAGADATVSGQAAERIYRAIDEAATVRTTLQVGPGARLEWLPQETILFDGAKLERQIDVDLAEDARLLMAESLVFGRRAHDETFDRGLLNDRWRIDRAGKPLWRDALRVAGGDPAFAAIPGFAGARALATVLYAGPDAAAHLEAAREALGDDLSGGATVVRGLLVARILDDEAGRMKSRLSNLVAALRAAALDRPASPPRVWQC